jgi:hypothetical protein
MYSYLSIFKNLRINSVDSFTDFLFVRSFEGEKYSNMYRAFSPTAYMQITKWTEVFIVDIIVIIVKKETAMSSGVIMNLPSCK